MNRKSPRLATAATVLGLCLAAAASAEHHVITASGTRWLYRGQSSGQGLSQALEIHAAPGDTLEFRQSDGRHGVFFYITPPGVSEMGSHIDIAGRFEVLPGHPPLTRLSNRLFDREALTTEIRRGNGALTAIRLREGFSAPLYFGCTALSTLHGTRMHGVIRPRVGGAARGHDTRQALAPTPEATALTLFSRAGGPTRDLGRLSKSPHAREILRDGALLRVGDDGETTDVTEQWFRGVPEADPRRHPWLQALAADLDGDADLDVVAAVTTPEGGGWRWRVLLSNVAQSDGQPDGALSFLTAEPVSPAVHPVASGAGPPLAASADIDSDGRPDLLLASGADPALEIFRNRGGASFDPQPYRLDLGSVLSGGAPAVLAAADLNSDGWQDLVVAPRRGDATVLCNDTRGRFPARRVQSLAGSAGHLTRVTFGDMDGDGVPDLTLAGEAAETRIYAYEGGCDLSLRP